MILVQEAVERLGKAGAPYGVRLSPWVRRTRAQKQLDAVAKQLRPLTLPSELRALWSGWDLGSLQWPVFDGFIPLGHLTDRREIEYPPCPAVLLPIADWNQSRVWIELGSKSHPGGRVFHSYHDDEQLSLWAFGMSGLLDLISTAFEKDLIDDRTGNLHQRHFQAVVKRSLDSLIGPDIPRTYEGLDRTAFPAHWLEAEGISQDHFALRGATHTVQSLRDERKTTGSVTATLVGTYEAGVGGGPLRGSIGVFTDDTGSIQVFVPQLTGLSGSVGRDGRVELDVLAVAPNGSQLDSLSARDDLQRAVSAGQYDYSNDIIIQLFEQMRYLDTSVVVTGLRSITS